MYGRTFYVYVAVFLAGCAATVWLVSFIAQLGPIVYVPVTLAGCLASMYLAGSTSIYIRKRMEASGRKK